MKKWRYLEKDNVDAFYLSTAGTAIILTILLWIGIYSRNTWLSWCAVEFSNVEIYVMGFCFFLGAIIVVGYLLCLNHFLIDKLYQIFKRKLDIVKGNYLCGSLVVIAMLLYMDWEFVTQFSEFGVSNAGDYFVPNHIKLILVLILLTNVAYLTYRGIDLDKKYLYFSYGWSILISFLGVYFVNPIVWGVEAVNIFSVTETIYNAVDLTPFLWKSTPLYGHYALFFFIPLKIFGANAITIALCIALSAMVEQIAFVYIVHQFKCQNWIKIIVTLGAVCRPAYIYPAITPIRTLMPLLISAWLVYLYKNNKSEQVKYFCLSFIFGGLSILWNTETGIGCLAGVIAYYLWMTVYQYRQCGAIKAFIKRTMYVFFLSAMALILPLVIVNGYNFICGENSIQIASYFYPYIGDDWAVNALRCNVPTGNHAWMYILTLIMGCIAVPIMNVLFDNERSLKFAPILGVAMVGMVVFAYYFNEAHWGCMDIVRKISAVLTLFIIQEFYVAKEDDIGTVMTQLKRSIVIIGIIIWGVLSISTVTSDPFRIKNLYKNGVYSYSRITDGINNNLVGKVPDNIWAVGEGINLIYHELDWDNHPNEKDLSAAVLNNHGDYEKLLHETLSHSEVLLGNTMEYDKKFQNDLFYLDKSYKLKKIIKICGHEYLYYSRTR